MKNISNKLILGTVQFGLNYGISNSDGKTAEFESHEIMDIAAQSGIHILDTAEGYGTAMEVIGKYHAFHSPFSVISKFGTKNANELEKELHRSLDLMKLDRLYAWMYHQPQELGQSDSITSLLKKLETTGLIGKAGVSIYSNEDFLRAIEDESVRLIQLPFNLLDNFSLRGDLLTQAKKAGKEIHVRSVFLQGLFFLPLTQLPPRLSSLEPSLRKLHEICESSGTSMEELALGYCLSIPQIDNCVVGVNHTSQLKTNLAAAKRLPEEMLERIHNIQVADIHLLNPSNWK